MLLVAAATGSVSQAPTTNNADDRPKMMVHLEVISALAPNIHHMEVLLPPFEQTDGAALPTIRWWEKPRRSMPLGALGAGENIGRQVQALPLTREQTARVADCVKDVRIASLYATSAVPEVCDGWTTKLSIAARRSTLQFEWFCDPPPEWIGVGALCDAINRAFIELQRESGGDG